MLRAMISKFRNPTGRKLAKLRARVRPRIGAAYLVPSLVVEPDAEKRKRTYLLNQGGSVLVMIERVSRREVVVRHYYVEYTIPLSLFVANARPYRKAYGCSTECRIGAQHRLKRAGASVRVLPHPGSGKR